MCGRMWRKITTDDARRSTSERPVTTATRRASVGTRIEEVLGWIKTAAGLRKTKLRGRPIVDWAFTFAVAADNLARAPKLVGRRHDQAHASLRPCLCRAMADRRNGSMGRY